MLKSKAPAKLAVNLAKKPITLPKPTAKSMQEQFEKAKDLESLSRIAEFEITLDGTRLRGAIDDFDDDDPDNPMNQDDGIRLNIKYGDCSLGATLLEQPSCCGIFFVHDLTVVGYNNKLAYAVFFKVIELLAEYWGYSMVTFTHKKAEGFCQNLPKDWSSMEFKNQRTNNRLLDCHKLI